MAYVVPIHRPSSVRHAIKLNLIEEDEECLVVAKANRIEIWIPSADGINLFHTLAIHGKISMLNAIHPPTSKTAHLFIGTERFQYFTLAWNAETNSLDTIQSQVDAAEKHMRDSQSLDRCSVDPSGQHIVMELFEGVLSIAKISKPKRGTTDYLGEPEQVRIQEKFIRSSTFVRSTTRVPKFAMLYTDGKDVPNVRLSTYRLTDEKGAQISDFNPVKDRENDIEIEDPGASMLIPVPGSEEHKRYLVRNAVEKKAQLGGVMVVGETVLLYLDDESKAIVEYAYDEAAIFVAWTQYDETTFFLGDDYGNLHLLELRLDGANVTGMDMRVVATTSKASQLVYLGGNLLYVASHEGDGQVLRIDREIHMYEVIQTLPNIAPILDFTIMDMGNRDNDAPTNEFSSGQARIVAGSGTFQSGSLRSVRSGVGLEDVGLLGEMSNVRAMFTLKGSAPFGFVDTLIISLITETRVIFFDSEGDPEEKTKFLGLNLEEPTLLARNVEGGKILQVSPSGCSLLDIDSETVSDAWEAPKDSEITTVSANESHILLSVDGKSLICLSIKNGLKELARQELGHSDQVACVHLPEGNADIAIVGFWQASSVSILNIETLEVIHGDSLRQTEDSAAVPRDIVMAQILPESTSGPTLLVSMSDGIVQTFNVDRTTYALSGKKSIVLGTQQPRFEVIPRGDGAVNIFATCEHSSLIYGAEGRLVYSAATAEDAICVCSFDSEAYPDSIVIATPFDVKICTIDDERRTHVNTLPMKEMVRRIAYSPKEKVFGLGTIKRTLEDGVEEVLSSFRLVDEVVFQEQGTPFLLNEHPGVEMIESVARDTFEDSYGKPAERFIVGTSFLDDAGIDVRGRILIFGIDTDRSPYLIASKKLKGACRCVTILDGMLVTTLVKTVVVWEYTEKTSSHGSLEKIATYRTSTLPIDLTVTDDGLLAVADLMKSISLVEFQKGEGGIPSRLVEVARHFESSWSTAVSHIEGDQFLEADADGNLLVLKREKEGVTLEDRIRMKVTSEINLGEQVNRIQRVSVDASERAIVVPRAFLATVEGSIHLFGTVAPTWQTSLLSIQTSLASHISSPGHVPWSLYRSFKNTHRETEEPFRFIDGELVERYLDLDDELQEIVAGEVGMSAVAIRGLVEELKRLH